MKKPPDVLDKAPRQRTFAFTQPPSDEKWADYRRRMIAHVFPKPNVWVEHRKALREPIKHRVLINFWTDVMLEDLWMAGVLERKTTRAGKQHWRRVK